MPVINTGPIQEVIKNLAANATIQSIIGKDLNNVYSIRPENFIPVGAVFPQITVAWNDGKSESILPSTKDTLRICCWLQAEYKEPYKTLDTLELAVISIFNRKGNQLNNLDVPSDSGIRFCQFVKMSTEKRWDDIERKYYCETIFAVVRSEGESFNPANAGNQAWT